MTSRHYRLTSTPTTVNIFDGTLERDIDVTGANVTVTDGTTTWTGTVTDPGRARGLDEWISGSIRSLAAQHGRAVTDELREALYQAGREYGLTATITIY